MANPFKKIGGLLASIAPTIATALGGPLAGTAVAAIAKAVTGDPTATPDKVEAQVLAATDPQVYVQIQKADNEFKLAMEQAGVDLEKVAAADRASAREREVQVKDNTPRNLAYIVLAFFASFAAAGSLIYLKENMSPATLASVSGFMGTVLGYLIGEVKQVFSYYYGTSTGSQDKTNIISDILNKK